MKKKAKAKEATKVVHPELNYEPATPDDLIKSAALDYNVLRTKLNRYSVSQNELNKAQEALESSFLWYRAACEKTGG
jgi:hypothetical protein